MKHKIMKLKNEQINTYNDIFYFITKNNGNIYY